MKIVIGFLFFSLSAASLLSAQTLWIDRSQRIYGGTEHGVFVSVDGGDSWSELNNGFSRHARPGDCDERERSPLRRHRSRRTVSLD